MENLKNCINNDLANNYEIYVRGFSFKKTVLIRFQNLLIYRKMIRDY